jgi:hypothetical protein
MEKQNGKIYPSGIFVLLKSVFARIAVFDDSDTRAFIFLTAPSHLIF